MDDFLAWAGLLLIFASPIFGFWLRARRKSSDPLALKLPTPLWSGMLLFVVGVIVMFTGANIGVEKDAVAAGFKNADEMHLAEQEGVRTGAEYHALIAERTKQAEAEAAKQARLEKEAAEAKAAADVAAKEACAMSAKCVGDKLAVDADMACTYVIEHSVKWDFQWTGGWLTPKYPYRIWHDKTHKAIDFIGDELKLQNGFGAWSRHVYRCTFDVASKSVVDLKVEQGRL